MGKDSKIEWTDHTFNPWWGCQKVSEGCRHCYAETLSNRWGHDIWGPPATTSRRMMSDSYWQKPLAWNGAAEAAGRRARVFCASMADVFEEHPDADAPRARLWELIEATPWLDWLLLTKRPENIDNMLPGRWLAAIPPNVWLGTSVEDQATAERRIRELLAVPAAVRFVSCEPLIGPINMIPYLFGDALGNDFTPSLDWVIVGGESGPGARPMEAAWAKSIVDTCEASSTPVFLKQLGGHPDKRGGDKAVIDGRQWHEFPKIEQPS